MSLSTDTLHELYATSSGFTPVVLLTIEHKSLTEAIRLSSDNRDIITQNIYKENIFGTISRGKDYLYFPFQIKLPSAHSTEAPRASLIVSNVTKELMPYIRNLQPRDGVPKVTIELIIAEQADIVILLCPSFDIVQISYGVSEVSFDLSAVSLAKEPFPSGTINPTYFKGTFLEI